MEGLEAPAGLALTKAGFAILKIAGAASPGAGPWGISQLPPRPALWMKRKCPDLRNPKLACR